MKTLLIFTLAVLANSIYSQPEYSTGDSLIIKYMSTEARRLVKERSEMIGQKKYTRATDTFDDNLYSMNTKIPGWYALGGLGYSLMTLKQENGKRDHYPLGFNVHSAVGYYVIGGYSVEAGSYIDLIDVNDVTPNKYDWSNNDELKGILGDSFNKVNKIDYINWNTTFYLGIKGRLPGIEATNSLNPYLKVFIGRGVSVLFMEADEDGKNIFEDKRFQLEGFTFGVSLSNVYNIFSKESMWFWELSFNNQMNTEYFFVEENGDLDKELSNQMIRDRTMTYFLRFTIGTRFF